jgi:hypothetical protein
LPAGVTTAGTTSPRKSPSPTASSKENISPSKLNPSQESLLKASLSRKQTGTYLATPTLSAPHSTSPVQSNAGRPPSNSSPLALSPIAPIPPTPPALPTTHGMRIPTSPRAGKRASAGSTSPNGSPLFNHPKDARSREGALKEFPTSTSSPAPVPEVASHTNQKAAPPTTVKPLPPLRLTTVSIKPVPGFPTLAPIPIPSSPKTAGRGRNALSLLSPPHPHAGTSSPPHSPVLSTGTQKNKHSFTLPFIKAGEAIRDVGVDVLKGVSSMSSAGVGSI